MWKYLYVIPPSNIDIFGPRANIIDGAIQFDKAKTAYTTAKLQLTKKNPFIMKINYKSYYMYIIRLIQNIRHERSEVGEGVLQFWWVYISSDKKIYWNKKPIATTVDVYVLQDIHFKHNKYITSKWCQKIITYLHKWNIKSKIQNLFSYILVWLVKAGK